MRPRAAMLVLLLATGACTQRQAISVSSAPQPRSVASEAERDARNVGMAAAVAHGCGLPREEAADLAVEGGARVAVRRPSLSLMQIRELVAQGMRQAPPVTAVDPSCPAVLATARRILAERPPPR